MVSSGKKVVLTFAPMQQKELVSKTVGTIKAMAPNLISSHQFIHHYTLAEEKKELVLFKNALDTAVKHISIRYELLRMSF